MLPEFIADHRTEILDGIRQSLVERYPTRDPSELMKGIDQALDDITIGIRDQDATHARALENARRHGAERKAQGFDLSRLVHDYGLVCETISQTALVYEQALDTREFQMLNRSVDEATASAVEAYSANLLRDEQDTQAEAVGVLAAEIRNAVGSASMAFEVVRSGHVGLHSKTSRLVERSHSRIALLAAQLAGHARLGENAVAQRSRTQLSDLLQAVRSVPLERGVNLELGIAVDFAMDVDPLVLTYAISSLVELAARLCTANTTLRLRARPQEGAVAIEIEAECGHLASEQFERLRDSLRSGTHEGSSDDASVKLAMVRRAVEAHGGTLLLAPPEPGNCSFSIVIPRTTHIVDDTTPQPQH
jgi:signal transduction histidine kinase